MDTLTYIVVAGWVLIYFMPSGRLAIATAAAMALLAVGVELVRRGEPMAQGGAMEFFLLAFALGLVAWPLRAAIRWLRDWWDGKVAGI